MNLKFYISVTKGLKLKVGKFLGLILTFVEVLGEKLVGGLFSPIMNRVNKRLQYTCFPISYDQCSTHIETSQFICCANQVTDFYMRRTLVVKGLI